MTYTRYKNHRARISERIVDNTKTSFPPLQLSWATSFVPEWMWESGTQSTPCTEEIPPPLGKDPRRVRSERFPNETRCDCTSSWTRSCSSFSHRTRFRGRTRVRNLFMLVLLLLFEWYVWIVLVLFEWNVVEFCCWCCLSDTFELYCCCLRVVCLTFGIAIVWEWYTWALILLLFEWHVWVVLLLFEWRFWVICW